MGGSVLPGLVVMAIEGEGVVDRSVTVAGSARWFIGHESAHFWLGQTVAYERAADAWITEGGADLMAVRALKALHPEWDDRAELQAGIDDCVRLAQQPVSTANERGEHRAYYACGTTFALAAVAAHRRAGGDDWFGFLKGLIDASREVGVLTREEWLTRFAEVAGGESRSEVETLLDRGSVDAAATVAAILERSGVAVRRDGDRLVQI
jgi:hypothetical protein